MFHLRVITIALIIQQLFSQHIHQPLTCTSHVQFYNRTADGWHGNLVFTPPVDLKGANIEVTFDDHVTIFTNNFAHSSTRDSRVFAINDNEKVLKSGQQVNVGFFVKSQSRFKIPLVVGVKLNDDRVCPEGDFSDGDMADVGDTGCAKFQMKTNGTGGRWDGILTVYPRPSRNGIRVDIELDEPAWALGNDLGDTRSFNQKNFIIMSRRNVRPGARLPINFFVKFDEFEEIPQLKAVYIDGVPLCISGLKTRPTSVQTSGQFSTEAPRGDNIRLDELPFERFPSVTLLPQQVNNNGFECGLTNAFNNRFNDGSAAESGQFPFHVALFRDLIYRCGGSLISSKTVITACHCVINDNKQLFSADSFRLLFGAVDLKSLSGSEAMREVNEVIKHPDYEHDKILKQDIALMIIKSNLQFSPTIRPICMFETQTPISNEINLEATVLGFGANAVSREPSRHLNYGVMSIISRQQCIESKLIFGLLPEDSAFCAKAVNNMIACPGDSGGGLIFINRGKYYLRGISSVTITEANQRCDPTQSVAFTDVSFFLTWIKQNMINE